MGKSKELSENEMEILYGQIHYPLLNDRELADRLNFKMTTLTAIKNRLKKNDLLCKIRIPLFNKFGCEMLQVSYGDAYPIDSTFDLEKVLAECEKNIPRSFYSIHGLNHHFIIQVFRHFTEAKRINDRFQQRHSKESYITGGGFKQILFPYQTIRRLNLFDHSEILKKTFGIDLVEMEPQASKNMKIGLEAVKLKRLEKKILYGLIKHPTLADSRVCKKIGTTRQAVARMRKKFETDGIIKTVKMANLAMLGYSIMALYHIQIESNGNEKQVVEGLKKIVEIMAPVFHVSDDTQSVHLATFRDFEHFQQSTTELYSQLARKGLVSEPPVAVPYSLVSKNLTLRHDYSKAIKNVLGI